MTAEAIYNLLVLARGGIAAPVYPVVLPEKPALPAITYQVVGGSSSPTFETSGMQRLRLQVDVFGEFAQASGYRSASNLRLVMVSALNGFTGVLSDGTLLQNVEFIQMIDGFENDARQYRCGFELYLYFTYQ